MSSFPSTSNESAVYDAISPQASHSILPAEKQVAGGSVTTGAVPLGETERLEVGVWEHSAGVSTDVEVDEVFVILSGRFAVILNVL